MATGRSLEHSSQFAKNLQSFAKKRDPGLPERVHQALASRLKQGPGNDCRLSGFQGLPLFKMRVPAQGRGKSGGARVVYFCDQELSGWCILLDKVGGLSRAGQPLPWGNR